MHINLLMPCEPPASFWVWPRSAAAAVVPRAILRAYFRHLLPPAYIAARSKELGYNRVHLCCVEHYHMGSAIVLLLPLCRYCCKACQVEHWKWHKPLCKELRKPAAAAADTAVE
jgi:hypothetical protein